jgi:hypothetical protein
MMGGKKLLSTSLRKQSGRLLWRHAPAQVSISGLGCLMSFAFAYIFSPQPNSTACEEPETIRCLLSK